MVRSRHLLLLGIIASAHSLCVDGVLADDKDDPVSSPQATEAQLPPLISQLSSDSFATRQKAQAKIQALAAVDSELVLGGSLEAYVKSVDPEVRYRLRSAMFGIVSNNLRPEGFIGIRMMDAPMRILKGREIVQENAVQILTVITGTAASDAGLRPGDRITKLDGNTFDGKLAAYLELSEYIRSKSAGDSVEISIKRGVDDLTVDLKLGARPDSIDEGRRERAFEDWFNEKLGRTTPAADETPAEQRTQPQLPRSVPIPRQQIAPFPFPIPDPKP